MSAPLTIRILPRGAASAAALLLCAAVAACAPQTGATGPVFGSAVTQSASSGTSAVVSSQSESLAPEDFKQIVEASADSAYRLGANDVISISVYMHPELSVPMTGTSGPVGGALITGDGSVELPLIGNVRLGGLTLAEAHRRITAAYATYIQDPKVSVQIVQAQSLRYYLLGAFTDPGVKYPVHPLSLLGALALGGSVDIPKADLYQAYVAQGSSKLPIDLHALLVDGDLSQNVTLAAGDAIVIPSASNENAFVLGAVGKPGAVSFQSGSLSLLQALSAGGMNLSNFTDAKLSNVHIIRAHGRHADFLVVNAAAILNGRAAPFDLRPGDVVFVPPTMVATWNQVLAQVIPSLQLISDTLNPFVQIKFLSQPQ